MARQKPPSQVPLSVAVALAAVLLTSTGIVWITGSTDGLTALGALVVATLGVLAGTRQDPPQQ